jgi:hypothetical protein
MRTIAVLAALWSLSAVAATVTVDGSLNRHPISNRVYQSANDQDLADEWSIDLSQASLGKVELLGVLGREGAISARPTEESDGPFKLYQDYDGAGARFGDTSIHASSTSPLLVAFAAFDENARVTVVLLNKSAESTQNVSLGFKGIGQKGAWRAFELDADGAIGAAGSGTIYDAVLNRTLRPTTALLIEFNPVGGILPIWDAAPMPATVAVEAPAAPPVGCSAGGAGGLAAALLVLVGLTRAKTLGSSGAQWVAE